MKKLLLAFIVSIGFFAARAQSEIFAPDGKAIRGYDPVAFFTESKAVKGEDNFTYSWKKAKWSFASQKNMEMFKANPEKYAPQYGGYCAYGLADGHKAPTETDTWTVKDDKLYFNYNKDVQKMWMKDQDPLIQKADKNWPGLKDKK